MTIEESKQPSDCARLPLAERRAVERHRYSLSKNRGREVSFHEALEDWLKHDAHHWRRVWHRRCMRHQKEEMLRHKWIESEKARKDLGDQAIFEWIACYAHSWREEFERTAPVDAEEAG